jgi:uncharacterized membrane protein
LLFNNGILSLSPIAGWLRMKKRKLFYLIPVVISLLVLLSPTAVLAQDKDELILNYVAGGYNNQISSEETKTLFIEVTNTSNTDTTDIHFSYDAPEGWVVVFVPQSISVLRAESIQTVEASVTAPQNVEKGDYSITIIADSSAGRRVVGTYFWVEKGSNVWVWVGSGLGLVLIMVFVFIYRRFTKE